MTLIRETLCDLHDRVHGPMKTNPGGRTDVDYQWCSGGTREAVTIDYEAGALLYLDDDMHGDLDLILTITRRIINAALGTPDE